ncbi:MAG: hypothetical protein JNG84_10370, partial [Archangium sp.]|nr:hypothetical protein [Archangium sp.]
MRRHFFTGLVLAMTASSALAQYVAAPQAGVPYPSLTTSSPVTLVASTGEPNDRGRATVALGFNFPYYTRTYTQLIVSANGMAFFEPSADPNADFLSNVTLPTVTEPNAVLAPFWDDLNGNNPTSAVRQQAVSGPNGAGKAIEWRDWNRAFGAYTLNFQIRLWENGVIEFFYGTMIGSGATITASVGIESPNGASATMPLAIPS